MTARKETIEERMLKDKCFELISLCSVSGTGYGVFFFETPDLVCGGADLSLGEIISLLEKISDGLDPDDISLIIESLRMTASKKIPG